MMRIVDPPPGITVQVASLPQREHVVAQLLYQGEQWGEISNEPGEGFILTLYPHRRGQAWRFSYDEAVEAIAEGKRRLLGGSE